MKTIALLATIFIIQTRVIVAQQTNFALVNNVSVAATDTFANLAIGLPIIKISGLSGLTDLGKTIDDKINPNLGVIANFYLGSKKQLNIFANYNLGIKDDTISPSNLDFTNFVIPEAGKQGFGTGISYDLISLIDSRTKSTTKWKAIARKFPSLSNVTNLCGGDIVQNKFLYFGFAPAYDFNYISKIANLDSISYSKIQAATHTLSVKVSFNYQVNDNIFALTVRPYLKFINVSDRSFAPYEQLIFQKYSISKVSDKTRNLGIIVNLQVNKLSFSFIYNDVSRNYKYMEDVDGVFLVKLDIAPDLLNF